MTWLDLPEDTLFGLENLPYGVFSTPADPARRVGIAVGDQVLDLAAALAAVGSSHARLVAGGSLDALLAETRPTWDALRAEVIDLLVDPANADPVRPHLHPRVGPGAVVLHLPFTVGDYVDFYASEHHASNLGRLFRPDSEPLMPNWKHLPVGYHGRAGTVVVSGTPIVRPCGQRKAPGDDAPTYGPTRRLDIEAELGFVVGTGSALGTRIDVDDLADHVFGAVIVNDWSARDLQAWEYVPLGPHLGKSFATSISPWVVPLAALDTARVPLPRQDPAPLPYLRGTHDHGLDVELVVEWNGEEVSRPPYRDMYWSPAQMLAHLSVNGASTRPGDLYASGTISGPERHQRGAFIELTWGGAEPVTVKGEQRTFLLDGDDVVISATAPGPDGRRIGFGEVAGTIAPAAD